MVANILIVLATFLFMEFMAWFAHKFVMHGFLWYLHKDHHQVEPGFLKKTTPSSSSLLFPAHIVISQA